MNHQDDKPFAGPNGDAPPWPDRPSIYAFLSAAIDPVTGALEPQDVALPDEQVSDKRSLRWAGGLRDQILDQRISEEQAETSVERIVELLGRITRENHPADQGALYELLHRDNFIRFLDDTLTAIAAAPLTLAPHGQHWARRVAREAPSRGPVKFAIALLGLIGDPADIELVMTLGLHDEFTRYSVVALRSIAEEPLAVLWQLAQRVHGWGRIHVVRQIITFMPLPEDIQAWLLREGYRNTIMHDYLAFQCATAGNLKVALDVDWIDDDLLEGAGDLIYAMLSPISGPSISDYADAVEVVERYLEHLQSRVGKVRQILVLWGIRAYLGDDETRRVWGEERQAVAHKVVSQLLADPRWPAIIERGLAAMEPLAFYQAAWAAKLLGHEIWSFVWARLQAFPLERLYWVPVMQRANPERIELILTFATNVLPLQQMATGPGSSSEAGPESRPQYCLQEILESLKRFPGTGWVLIATGLKSPVTRVRNTAVRLLAAWGRAHWPQEAEDAVREATALELSEGLKERMERLLRNETSA